MHPLPRVGISRCLLGEPVRYDGGHKYDAPVLEALAPHVEWVPVCPELEAGMGVPREPIHLVSSSGGPGVRLLGVGSGRDWTARMHQWTQERVAALRESRIAGFVLKSRSPSCGLRDVPVSGGAPGAGLFAALLMSEMPDLPIEDEERLRDDDRRAAFLQRVRAYHAHVHQT